jgi:hypothetical protein
MNNQELRVHANNMDVWSKKMKAALNIKKADAIRSVENNLSEAATQEITANHDEIIAVLSAPWSAENPHGEPTRQQAIDSLIPEESTP